MQTSDDYDFEWTLEQLRGRVGSGCVVYVSARGGQIASFAGVMAEVEPRDRSVDELPVYYCLFHTVPGTGYYGFFLNPATFERSWVEDHMTLMIGQAGASQIAIEGRPFDVPSQRSHPKQRILTRFIQWALLLSPERGALHKLDAVGGDRSRCELAV